MNEYAAYEFILIISKNQSRNIISQICSTGIEIAGPGGHLGIVQFISE
jgi:hypothetical protein